MFAKSHKKKEGAEVLIGFALLFIGLSFMSGSIEPYRDAPILSLIHIWYGDRRMEILSACARTVGFPEADALLPMNTTEEAADFLYEHGYLKQVMEQVANQVKAVLEEESGVQTEVMLFSSNYGPVSYTHLGEYRD